MKNVILVPSIVVCAMSIAASAVDILPGDIITLPGTTTPDEFEIVGAPVWGDSHVFEIHGLQGQLLYSGIVDVNVIFAALPQSMLFEFRIHDTVGGLLGEIKEVRWTGFAGATTNCNWRSDLARGDVAVMRAGRTWDSDTITFGYNWWLHNPGGEVLSMFAGEDSSTHFVLSDAPAFKVNGAELTIELLSGESWSTAVPGVEWDIPADFNGDGVVDGADMGLLIAEWGQVLSFGDLNGDGVVNGGDVGMLLAYWGTH